VLRSPPSGRLWSTVNLNARVKIQAKNAASRVVDLPREVCLYRILCVRPPDTVRRLGPVADE
jgi:hypothetical protein